MQLPCPHVNKITFVNIGLLRVAHAPGMPGTFSPPTLVSHPDMHHGTCATHVPWCIPGSLTNGFLWSRWRGKRSRRYRRMRNTQFYVSGMRPIASVPSWSSVHRIRFLSGSLCSSSYLELLRKPPSDLIQPGESRTRGGVMIMLRPNFLLRSSANSNEEFTDWITRRSFWYIIPCISW